MIRLALALFLLGAATGVATELDLWAPNQGTRGVDQLAISGNACGPAALLNALQAGQPSWQAVAAALPGDSDRARMSYIIRAHGLHPSRHLEGRLRWDRKNGINLLDLRDVGNELCGGRSLHKLRHEVLVQGARESDRKLLERAHSRLAKSLKRGLPPVVSLRRMAHPRAAQPGSPPNWRVIHGHFVVVTALPAKLPKGASAFPFRYIDPWGGRILEGTIGVDPTAGFPSLVAEVPGSRIGKANVKEHETSIVSLSSTIGAL